jgi:pyruvate,water dikinase
VPDADRRRFSITDDEATELARIAIAIEKHYGRAMDVEWGRDGVDGKLYVLQARPETVRSRDSATDLKRYRLASTSKVLASGRAIGQKIGQGTVRLVKSAAEMDRVKAGDVLVTDMTDPDWEPVMKRASAIVTNRGGRTCHAAIIARELGIPAVVGCEDATRTLAEGASVTVSCAEGDTGHVYEGKLEIEVVDVALDRMPPCPTKIMMNVGNPSSRSRSSGCPTRASGSRGSSSSSARTSACIPRRCSSTRSFPPSSRRRSRRASTRTATRSSTTSRRSPRAWPRSPPRSGRRR